MQTKVFVLLILASFSGKVVADRPLERVEILRIFETLTSQPRKTWIPSGTIRARHEEYGAPKITDPNEIANRINRGVQAYLENPNKLELTEELQRMKLEAIPFNVRYKLSNEYTMVSNVIVKLDGGRFYWEIDVNSRMDSIRPTIELAGNFFTEEFDLDWNQRRVFAWDGEKYTTYFRPGNHAIVTNIPSGINGPLTTGVIPWGYGRYSHENLSSAQSSATEVESNGQAEIHLTVINGDKQETFVLDPVKDYAVKLYSAVVGNASMTVANYGNYQSVGGNWCPGNIIIEQYDTATNPTKLMVRDIWDFTSSSNGTPGPGSFDVDYEYDAFIEDYRLGSEPLQYRYSPPAEPSISDINVAKLLQDRLEIASEPEPQGQNCATVSLKYACEKLGFSPSWKDLDQVVHGVDKKTTMFEMQQFVQNMGLSSLAVKTDLETLKVLGNCQTILHLPRGNHYVVLGNIDDKYVRLIDLDKNNFYYRYSIGHFDSVWGNAALIVGDGPIGIKGNFARIDDGQLREITGAENCQSCTKKIQNSGDSACPDNGVPGSCGGCRTIYYERYGCERASSGSCYEYSMLGSKSQVCGTDPNDFSKCAGDGEWTASSIEACK
ncbi:MAG: hypothetical protein KAV87_11495 [Desulfobacteraceae bacterium]|nr:hypothetical protein [Desulfobacteraceae bacterium]